MWIIIIIVLCIVAYIFYKNKQASSKKVDFTNKSDTEIKEIFESLSSKQQSEILEFLRKNVALIQTVAKVKNIPLQDFNIEKEREDYSPEMFYGIRTYTKLKHVYDLLTR